VGDLRSYFRRLQVEADARLARSQARVADRRNAEAEGQAYRRRQREEMLAAIKLALAATPLQAYASVSVDLQARQIFDASGLSGHAGAYEEILAAVKATVERANSPEAKAQRFLDVYAALDRPGWPDPPAPTGLAKQILDASAIARAGGPAIPPPPSGSVAAQIIEAARKNRNGEGSKR